ncbi:MAG: asparagine synthase (glutamine-hydrolyzing) [bacterium]
MCGIVGVWNRGSGEPVDKGVLLRMAGSLRHRGPDDAGHMIDGALGLAHRRLAIIDLTAAGRQPMTTPDGRYTIVFNGEIYNYGELAKKYCADVNLRSTSDTEILLHVLAKKGRKALPELRGMFALALWDVVERRLLIATDPFGKKPLYWMDHGDTFLFASEIKALLEHPQVSRDMDRLAMARYFLYEYVPAPATGYREIRQVPMGHYVEITAPGIDVRQWWKPTFMPKREGKSEREVISRFDEKMRLAVRRRMIADVPVGVLLSGGIDSTSIAWYMKQEAGRKIHSFSVSFVEQSFNEGGFAEQAAKTVGTEHHDLRFGLDEFKFAWDKVTEKMDIPFGDASILPTYAVSELAREHITVALDGDGSDELLGGYGTFRAAQLSQKLPRLSKSVWQALYEISKKLPTSYGYFSLDFKAKSFLKGMGYDLPHQNQVWLGSFSDVELRELLTDEWQEYLRSLFADVNQLLPELERLDVADVVSLMTIYHYLHNDILTKLDRATMFVSLEARTPFLDVDLAEYVMRLPAKYKKKKYILKQAMRGRIPDAIIDREKQGFALPLGQWLKGPLFEWAREILAEDKLRTAGVMRPETVRRLLKEHRRGNADHRKKIWTLIAWQAWYDRWMV